MKSYIYKYVFPHGEITMSVPMYERSEVVHVGADPVTENVTIWVLHHAEPTEEPHEVGFSYVGTGWDLDPALLHVGSVVIGIYVWHVMRHSGTV